MRDFKKKPLEAEDLLNYALRSFAVRAQTISELRDKLRRRAAQPSDVDEVLSKMKQAGFLNDRTFADSYATARLENRGFGKMRVLRDLQQRRVPSTVAGQAVEQAFQETDESDLIKKYLARKYRGKDLAVVLKIDKELASAYRKLRVAGFTSANSIKVLKGFTSQAELLEDPNED